MAITPVPPLSDVPDFPALSDRSAGTYNSKAYAFGTHMANTFNGELAALASNVHSNAHDASASASMATTKAAEAAASAATANTKAGEAAASATNAASSASAASTAATTATTKAGEASTSASNAATSAGTATTKAGEALASEVAAELAKDNAVAAAGAIGPLKFFATKAAATAGLATIPADELAEVAADESMAGSRTRYRKTGGVLVFEVDLDQLRVDLNDQSKGAEIVKSADGRSVKEWLDAAHNGLPTALVPSLGVAAGRNCTLHGDSISEGAFSGNSFMHSWPRVFERCFNAELGASSYGFEGLLNLGSGATLTTKLHSVQFTGAAWGGVDNASDPEVGLYPTGQAMQAGGANSNITITVPSFQSRALIYYAKRPGGAQFKVYVNGAEVLTVTTDAPAGYDTAEIAMVDNGYGDNTISINSQAGGLPIRIIGIAYLAPIIEPVFNNFGRSGQRLRYVAEGLIAKLMAESATYIMALGHNDQVTADTDDAYYAAFMQRITWLTTYAKQYGVRMVIPDFCWAALPTSRTRLALRKLAADTGGLYIDLPSEIFKNRETLTVAQRNAYLVTPLGMWTDQSHPNKLGHQWIAETIAKRMGLSVSSKARAVSFHDWWMPFALRADTGAYNYFPGAVWNLSGYKRNGNMVIARFYVRKAATGAFPVGSWGLSDSWRVKSELAAAQGYAGIAMIRQDTGATVSTVAVSASGQITLRVDSAWVNEQAFTFSMQMTG